MLRLSFTQINRVFKAYKVRDNELWEKFRLIAYETWRKGAKNAPDIDVYMPLEESKDKEPTKKQLDDVWAQYGKLDKKKKRIRLFRRNRKKKRKNVRAKT